MVAFRDEHDKETINDVDFDIIGDAYSKNYTTTDGQLLLKLLTPEEYTGLAASTGYLNEEYYFEVTKGTTQSFTVYLLNGSKSYTNVTINIIDQSTEPVEGAIVKILKKEVETNEFTQVANAQTNFEGQTIQELFLYDVYYKFIIEYEGEVVDIISPTTLTSDTITRQIVIGGTPTQNYDTYQDVTASITGNAQNDTFNITYSHGAGTDIRMCGVIKDQKGSVEAIECQESSSGVITVSFNPENHTTYTVQAIYIDEYGEYAVTSYSWTQGGSAEEAPLKEESLIALQIILSLALLFIGLIRRPGWSPALLGISLLVGRSVGLIFISWPAIWAMAIGMVLITVMVENR